MARRKIPRNKSGCGGSDASPAAAAAAAAVNLSLSQKQKRSWRKRINFSTSVGFFFELFIHGNPRVASWTKKPALSHECAPSTLLASAANRTPPPPLCSAQLFSSSSFFAQFAKYCSKWPLLAFATKEALKLPLLFMSLRLFTFFIWSEKFTSYFCTYRLQWNFYITALKIECIYGYQC